MALWGERGNRLVINIPYLEHNEYSYPVETSYMAYLAQAECRKLWGQRLLTIGADTLEEGLKKLTLNDSYARKTNFLSGDTPYIVAFSWKEK